MKAASTLLKHLILCSLASDTPLHLRPVLTQELSCCSRKLKSASDVGSQSLPKQAVFLSPELLGTGAACAKSQAPSRQSPPRRGQIRGVRRWGRAGSPQGRAAGRDLGAWRGPWTPLKPRGGLARPAGRDQLTQERAASEKGGRKRDQA